MRTLLLGVITAVAVMAAPAAVSASPTPNGHNCVGVADSSLAGPGFGTGVVSPLARAAPRSRRDSGFLCQLRPDAASVGRAAASDGRGSCVRHASGGAVEPGLKRGARRPCETAGGRHQRVSRDMPSGFAAQ